MSNTAPVDLKSKQVFDRALGAIKLDKKIKDETKLLEQDKQWLRDNAPVTDPIIIPGHGSVQIKKGSAATTGGEKYTVTTFHPEVFKELPAAMRKKLLTLGVVTVEEKTTEPTKEGTKSVVFNHNK